MLDADLNCWLIEVNTNPCLEESSKLLEMLIPRMVDDSYMFDQSGGIIKSNKLVANKAGVNNENDCLLSAE